MWLRASHVYPVLALTKTAYHGQHLNTQSNAALCQRRDAPDTPACDYTAKS